MEWCSTTDANPCLNGAKCVRNGHKYKCECSMGYEGSNCEINSDNCVNHKCQFGVCLDGIGNYTCKCKDGFSGFYCDIMVPVALPLQQDADWQVQPHSNSLRLSSNRFIECSSESRNPCLNGGLCYANSKN